MENALAKLVGGDLFLMFRVPVLPVEQKHPYFRYLCRRRACGISPKPSFVTVAAFDGRFQGSRNKGIGR